MKTAKAEDGAALRCSIVARARLDENIMPEPNSGCWLWLGSVSMSYGTLYFEGRTFRAHRASYLMNNGPLKEGQVVMHTCDNKLCVNPDHLKAVSSGDNIRDYFAKKGTAAGAYLRSYGEAPRSSRVDTRKLTIGQAAAIRYSNVSNRKIARLVGVDHTLVGSIKRGLCYPEATSATPDPILALSLSEIAPAALSHEGK